MAIQKRFLRFGFNSNRKNLELVNSERAHPEKRERETLVGIGCCGKDEIFMSRPINFISEKCSRLGFLGHQSCAALYRIMSALAATRCVHIAS